MRQLGIAAARRRLGAVARRNAVRGRQLPAASAIDALLPPDVRVAAALARFRRNVAVRGRRTGSCSCRSRSSCRRRSGVGRSVEAPRHVANGLVPAASALAALVLRYSRISAVVALRRRPDVAVGLRVHLGAVETPRHVANRLVPATLALSAGARVYSRIAAVDPFRRMTDVAVWLSWIRGSGGGRSSRSGRGAIQSVEAPFHALNAGIPATAFRATRVLIYARMGAVNPVLGVADVTVRPRKLGGGGNGSARLETPRRVADVRVPAATLALTHQLPDSVMTTLHSLLWKDVARRSGCNRTPTHCSHCPPPQSMRNRVYETVERPSVHLSVPSTDSRDVQRLCC